MDARELMTRNPACCTPDDTVRAAAQLMVDHDCGLIPVVDDQRTRRLVGVITDRDLACRVLARGSDAKMRAGDAMSTDVGTCKPSDSIRRVEEIMRKRQVRRVPVVDSDGTVVGIIAQADLARISQAASDQELKRVLERVSEPGAHARH